MKKVLFTENVHPSALELMHARSDIELVIAPDTQADTLRELARDVDGIGVRLALLPEDVLCEASNLKVVSRHGVGCDNVDVAHLSSRNIPMAIAAGANGISVAEHTLMLMLTASRRLLEQDQAVRAGKYHERLSFSGIDLYNSHVLVVGFGRTGQQVAPRCKALGMQVTAADIKPDHAAAKAMGIPLITDFHEALPEADFITVHVPLDQSTQHLLSEAEFSAMKPGAIVINCARGGVVDEAALMQALDVGKVKCAGIDVFEREPAVADDPLFKRSDIIATPHTAGTSNTALVLMATMMAQNILDTFDGKLQPGKVLNVEDIQWG